MAKKKVDSTAKVGTKFSTSGTEQPADIFPQTTVYRVIMTFIEGLLGTVPYSKEVYAQYIAKSAPATTDTGDELSTVPQQDSDDQQKIAEEKGWTGFHMLKGKNGEPDQYLIYDYAVKGYFKEACSSLWKMSGSESAKLTAFKKNIDKLLFVYPRQLILLPPDGQPFMKTVKDNGNTSQVPGLEVLERPIRVATPKGERVALVRSDTCPPGTRIEMTVHVLVAIPFELIKEWFQYGVFGGMGQCRSGGYGRFRCDVEVVHEGENSPVAAVTDEE